MRIITVLTTGHPSSMSRALTSIFRTSKQKENKGLFKDNDCLNIPLHSLRVLSWCETFLHCFKNRCQCGIAQWVTGIRFKKSADIYYIAFDVTLFILWCLEKVGLCVSLAHSWMWRTFVIRCIGLGFVWICWESSSQPEFSEAIVTSC